MRNENMIWKKGQLYLVKMLLIFLKTVKTSEINRPLISQLVRSATSIGANYAEADGGVSKKDFKNKIGICKKNLKKPNIG
jgi:four helix bundle protein